MVSIDKVKVTMLAALLALLFCLIDVASSEDSFVCTSEQHRPKYHFSPKANWMNDPNGMVYYEGVYHLFFQYHPNSTVWGPMHWGHAISKNLVTWEELPIAIKPNEYGTIFSGSAVVDYENTAGFKKNPNEKDPIVAIYTSAQEDNQRQSIAYSLDGGYTFTDYANNPVLSYNNSPVSRDPKKNYANTDFKKYVRGKDPIVDIYSKASGEDYVLQRENIAYSVENPVARADEPIDFRDPKVFYLNDRWIMSLAVKDRIEFYSSPDLKNWTKESEFGGNIEFGNHDGVWECPDMLHFSVNIAGILTELWVLLVSINPGGPNRGSSTQYFVGSFTNTSTNYQFQSYQWSDNQWMDWGPDNYAGVTFSNDPNGRHIYMGWMSNWLYADKTPNPSHRGQMTIPRQLGVRVLNHATSQYRLTSVPAPEIDALRNTSQSFIQNQGFPINSQMIRTLTDQIHFKTPTMELEINMEMKTNSKFSICADNNVSEEVCFGYNSTHWFIDRSKSGNVSFSEEFGKTLHAYATREINDESTSIRIFLDVSSIEVFTDSGLTTMTALYFPSEPFYNIHIKDWRDTADATLVVKNYRIYGLNCGFGETVSAASNYRLFNFAAILIAIMHVIRRIL